MANVGGGEDDPDADKGDKQLADDSTDGRLVILGLRPNP